MFGDLKYIILWWSTFLVLGTIALPLTFAVFKKFWDKGYLFSKIISLILLTYIIFVFGVFRLLSFTTISLFAIIVFALIFNFFYLRKKNNFKEFLTTLKSHQKIFLFEEFIFLAVLIFWSFIRGHAPDIEGLEKYMDWGFVNSALRSQFLPPADMWFSGFPINYYYFGHLMVAVLTKLSNISSAITYNLAMASTCALTFSLTFSLSSNLAATLFKKINYRAIIVAGLFSALLLTFGGNLHPIYKIAKIDIQNEGKLVLTSKAISKAASMYWYPDATRFIGYDPDIKDKTIHEFPIYSFVVADLHGHMNDIPNILLFMALLFSLSLFAKPKRKWGIDWQLVIPAGFLLSIAYMTNAWDFAVYGLVFAFFSFIYQSHFTDLKSALTFTFLHGFLIIIFWYLFNLPFSLNFSPMVEGLRLSDSHSPFYQLFILYGGFWLICLPFIIWFVVNILRQKISKLNLADIFVFSLIITATFLIILPEIGYIKDIYINDYRRANTMFKLVYEAFIMYALVSGYIFIRLRKFIPLKIIFILVFMTQMIYPYFAIKSYYGLEKYKGLWGLNYLKDDYPDNFAAINWINANISGQPVMLEAAGDSYTTFDQVSVCTGLPTVEGWIVHEWLWRGGYDKPAARQTDVQKIYESTNKDEVRSLLQKYSVKYIFVGSKEREQYKKLNEQAFVDLGAKIIFESGQTRVYQL
jgi:uncharacterized membrane protein